MENNFIKKTLTIGKITLKDNRYSLVDQDGDTYSFFTEKKDGTPTRAFSSFKELNVKENDIIGISYKIAGKFKNVLWFEIADPTAKVPPFVNKKEIEEKMSKREEDKTASIAWEVAKKSAVVLIAHHPLFAKIPLDLLEETIGKWTKEIYDINLKSVKEKAEIYTPKYGNTTTTADFYKKEPQKQKLTKEQEIYAENEVKQEQEMGIFDEEEIKDNELPPY